MKIPLLVPVLVVTACGSSPLPSQVLRPSYAYDLSLPSPSDLADARDLSAAPADLGAPPPDLAPPADLARAPDLSPVYTGMVLLDDEAATDVRQSYVYAFFGEAPAAPGCTHTAAGSCWLDLCSPSPQPPAPPRLYSAGTILVTGGVFPVLIAPPAEGQPYPIAFDPSRPLWYGGETLTVSGSGDFVPPFGASLPAPAPVVIIEPELEGTQVYRSQDLALAWSAVGGTVEITLFAGGDGSGATGTLDCATGAASGGFTLPASLMQQLPAGGALLVIESTAESDVSEGAWHVRLFARVLATHYDGRAWQETIELL